MGSNTSEATPSTGKNASSAASVVIGASTFTSIQEQLSALRSQVYGTGNSRPVAQQSGPSSFNNGASTGMLLLCKLSLPV